MAVFSDADDLYASLGAFFVQLVADPEMIPKFRAADTSFVVHYTDPTSAMFVDCRQDPPTVVLGPPEDADAEITLEMSADTGHKFWLGDLNMTVALAKRQVAVKGSMSKMMKLLPAMRPAFTRYREYLLANGFDAKVSAK
jgi:putative sterol carrier protein